jgi:hypothetical protein|tara:strand:+ start:399 stop:587 length:189 start_codon:yes stop_codon:yes gene_type:complete
MIWILIWLQLGAGKSLDYYHIQTFDNKDACVKELSKAAVLVTHKNATIDCIPVEDIIRTNSN